MAQLSSVAGIATAGLGLFSQIGQHQAQRQQVAAANAQEAARQRQVAAQQAETQRQRQDVLSRTIASARARAGASGIGAGGGSVDALIAGLSRDSAEAQAADDATYQARLAAGRRSLLDSSGSLVPFIRSATSFGGALRNLLD